MTQYATVFAAMGRRGGAPGRRPVPERRWRRRAILGTFGFASKFVSSAHADYVAARRQAANGEALNVPVLEREQQIGARAVDGVVSVGSVSGQVLKSGTTLHQVAPQIVGEGIVEAERGVQLKPFGQPFF